MRYSIKTDRSTGGGTGMTKLILVFPDFANQPKNLRQWGREGGRGTKKLACYTFDTPNLENSVTVPTYFFQCPQKPFSFNNVAIVLDYTIVF
jgi:hypothetical protein